MLDFARRFSWKSDGSAAVWWLPWLPVLYEIVMFVMLEMDHVRIYLQFPVVFESLFGQLSEHQDTQIPTASTSMVTAGVIDSQLQAERSLNCFSAYYSLITITTVSIMHLTKQLLLRFCRLLDQIQKDILNDNLFRRWNWIITYCLCIFLYVDICWFDVHVFAILFSRS